MATITTDQIASHRPATTQAAPSWGRIAALCFSAAMPLGAFGLANLLAEASGHMPMFFAPANMPGWVGAAIHLSILPCLGVAYGLIIGSDIESRRTGRWLAAFIAALIAFPFVVAPLDSLTLAIIVVGILLLGLATLSRVARLSKTAGWLMAPALVWLTLCAALGVALAAAWTPPFALTDAEEVPPLAG